LQPGVPLIVRARVAFRAGNFIESAWLCRLRLAERADDYSALELLGASRAAGNHLPDAVEAFQRALAVEPARAAAHFNLARARHELGDVGPAIAGYRQVLRLAPDHPKAWANLGSALLAAGQPGEAVHCLLRARDDNPRFGQIHANLGLALYQQGRTAEAEEQYRRALELGVDESVVRFHLAAAQLKRGQLAAGWMNFESRLESLVVLRAPPGCPRWRGPLPHPVRHLLVITEQGIGDAIQFIRFGTELRRRGIAATLQCPPRIERLLRSGSCFDSVVSDFAATDAPADAWCPLLSLPYLLGIDTAESLQMPNPYLFAESRLVDRWRNELGKARGLDVGIAWQGNPAAEIGALRGRSIPLCEFAILLRDNVRFHTLQTGVALGQLATVNFGPRIDPLSRRLDVAGDAFVDTAAVMMSLDLVITSDTAVAHLAAALGRPTWIALHAPCDWRWLEAGSSSAWYPTARLFRQRTAGDWRPVFTEMRTELDALAAPTVAA
jgi:Tfp pilus assembly protein PilF